MSKVYVVMHSSVVAEIFTCKATAHAFAEISGISKCRIKECEVHTELLPALINDNSYRETCSYASRYKAVKKPTCGCKICNTKYYTKLLASQQ